MRDRDKSPLIVSIICGLLCICIGIISWHSCGRADNPIEETTQAQTTNGDIGFVPSPEAKFVYVVDREEYYHCASSCGAIITDGEISRLHLDTAVQLGFERCPICYN